MMLMVVLTLGVLYNTVECKCKSRETLSEAELAVLDKHNALRSHHLDTEPLCYGEDGDQDDVTFGAQEWADTLASTLAWEHSTRDVGENIFVSFNFNSKENNWVKAAAAWYKEIEYWNNDRVCKGTGHYTQIVWRDTKQVNCGFATAYWSYAITVCQYWPGGNVDGQYDDQVGPLRAWLDNLRCGNDFPIPDGITPAQCDPDSKNPCCSANNHCGSTPDHCGPWRNDLRCGPGFHLAFGEEAECNPDTVNGKGHCCSPNGWCGKSDIHCNCPDCIDYSKSDN